MDFLSLHLKETREKSCKTNRESNCSLSLSSFCSADFHPYIQQVLGRKSPFPLILLPQFGGYWIEGTNHELSEAGDPEQHRPPSPSSRTKLECNTTATLYRKHFLGKVSCMTCKLYLQYQCSFFSFDLNFIKNGEKHLDCCRKARLCICKLHPQCMEVIQKHTNNRYHFCHKNTNKTFLGLVFISMSEEKIPGETQVWYFFVPSSD